MATHFFFPEYRSVPEIGRASNDNEFCATFTCRYEEGGSSVLVESAELCQNSLKGWITVGSIGGEIHFPCTTRPDERAQQILAKKFLAVWEIMHGTDAKPSVVGVYHIIREVVSEGRFISC